VVGEPGRGSGGHDQAIEKQSIPSRADIETGDGVAKIIDVLPHEQVRARSTRHPIAQAAPVQQVVAPAAEQGIHARGHERDGGFTEHQGVVVTIAKQAIVPSAA